MKGNEISVKQLNADATAWLAKLHQTMLIKDYGKGSVRNYTQEMRLLFKYCNHKAVADITQADIEQYMQYIKEVHKVGRAKCRSVAQACSFFFKRILPAPYIVPSNLYPKKQFILPNIMTEEEVMHLFAAPLSVKEYSRNRVTLWMRPAHKRSKSVTPEGHREQQSTAKGFPGKRC